MTTTIINSSAWLHLQLGSKHIYSPNPAIIQHIQTKQTVEPFWLRTYTAFACIIYDVSLQKIIAVRDHFGVEPCYYSYHDGKFIFGSTIPSVLNQIHPYPEMNTTQLNQLFYKKWFDSEVYSDETYYQSIYRVDPGCELIIDVSIHKDIKRKTTYWDLKQCNDSINYADKRDYVSHFSQLLSEALQIQTDNHAHIAAEFSGGLDSSAVVAAAHHNHIDPTLYMHIAPAGSHNVTDDLASAKILIHQLGIKNCHYINANDFNLLASMQEYAQYFAGAAPYNGFVLSHPIHSAIAQHNHSLVLSGVGGDECVSGHAPLKIAIPQIAREQGLRAAYKEIYQNAQIKGQPTANRLKQYAQLMKWVYTTSSSSTLREYEHNLLQGSGSYPLRMRIEYNSVLARSLGFSYAYPLLYPPLVEFCYRLPLEHKRRYGNNRCLIRDYLAQFFPATLHGKQTKSGGVTPATIEKTRQLYLAGAYNQAFGHLPFKKERDYAKQKSKRSKVYPFLCDIPAYMFKTYWNGLTQAPLNL